MAADSGGRVQETSTLRPGLLEYLLQSRHLIRGVGEARLVNGEEEVGVVKEELNGPVRFTHERADEGTAYSPWWL